MARVDIGLCKVVALEQQRHPVGAGVGKAIAKIQVGRMANDLAQLCAVRIPTEGGHSTNFPEADSYLLSNRQAPSQSASGGRASNCAMRASSVREGPSPGTASSAALKAVRASS